MPNPTRDELKQAVRYCLVNDLCTDCVLYHHADCHRIKNNALLSTLEREDKMLAVVQEAIDGRPPREWVKRMADLYAEAKLAAIKAAEEGEG